jgi:hypothetical protein
MSYNGSGTFQINSTGQPVVGGTIISSATFNALTADLATGLTTAITKDGQTTTTARILFAQGINSTLVTDASSTSTGSIFTAGGVGIAKKLYVGTDANIAGNALITGTLGITGVATFSAAPIYSSLTASSAVATDASKALVSVTNTGTGSNVLATSPTITTATIASANLTTALTLAGAAGTNGQVLTSAGSGLPSWTTPSSGALTLLSTVTASVAATADIETTFSSTYDAYLLIATNVTADYDGAAVNLRMKLGGSYVTSATYLYHQNNSASDSTSYVGVANAADIKIILCNTGVGSAAAKSANFTIRINQPASTTLSKQINWIGSYIDAAGVLHTSSGVASNTATTALTGIRFFAGGNISGTFRLYGIANS